MKTGIKRIVIDKNTKLGNLRSSSEQVLKDLAVDVAALCGSEGSHPPRFNTKRVGMEHCGKTVIVVYKETEICICDVSRSIPIEFITAKMIVESINCNCITVYLLYLDSHLNNDALGREA